MYQIVLTVLYLLFSSIPFIQGPLIFLFVMNNVDKICVYPVLKVSFLSYLHSIMQILLQLGYLNNKLLPSFVLLRHPTVGCISGKGKQIKCFFSFLFSINHV